MIMPEFKIIALDFEKDTGRHEIPKLNFSNSVVCLIEERMVRRPLLSSVGK
jgi:hypothetical protein